uniref:Uncharacterized protein n=1 Tax=Rhodosorus marinus TaxID=101924 RepID=A0A7S3A564_9RHOD
MKRVAKEYIAILPINPIASRLLELKATIWSHSNALGVWVCQGRPKKKQGLSRRTDTSSFDDSVSPFGRQSSCRDITPNLQSDLLVVAWAAVTSYGEQRQLAAHSTAGPGSKRRSDCREFVVSSQENRKY